MSEPRDPRAHLATHEVTNQAEPFGDIDLWRGDALVRGCAENAWALADVGDTARADHAAHLATFGAAAGAEDARALGRLANENPPKFTPFDRFGRRVDEVEFHPAYHDLMALGLGGGVSARAWTHSDGGHVAHAALMTMMGVADAGVCCPRSMTYAVTPALAASEWSNAEWRPRVVAGAYDARAIPATEKAGATMGMAMTEKQGGSDVRANATRAEPLDGSADEVALVGHKWFCSAPMSDAFLTLAYEDAGLSCFLVPRWTPDGKRNAIEIQRLKDKLGDRSNASSEIEYKHAWARRVGEPGRGVRTIIDMVHHTRLDCLVGSAGGVRHATALAIRHCEGRAAFQKKLIDQPAMMNVLADLALESIAAYALAFRVASAFDDPKQADFARIATPLAKYWLCKRQPGAVYEAVECHGGAGFVEDSGLPRLFRQSPLNAIWEGSGNVIALDVLRAIGKEPEVFEALLAELENFAGQDRGLDALAAWLKDAPSSGALSEPGALLFAERAALALQAAAVARLVDQETFEAFTTLRILQPSHLYGANADNVGRERLIEKARWSA